MSTTQKKTNPRALSNTRLRDRMRSMFGPQKKPNLRASTNSFLSAVIEALDKQGDSVASAKQHGVNYYLDVVVNGRQARVVLLSVQRDAPLWPSVRPTDMRVDVGDPGVVPTRWGWWRREKAKSPGNEPPWVVAAAHPGGSAVVVCFDKADRFRGEWWLAVQMAEAMREAVTRIEQLMTDSVPEGDCWMSEPGRTFGLKEKPSGGGRGKSSGAIVVLLLAGALAIGGRGLEGAAVGMTLSSVIALIVARVWWTPLSSWKAAFIGSS